VDRMVGAGISPVAFSEGCAVNSWRQCPGCLHGGHGPGGGFLEFAHG